MIKRTIEILEKDSDVIEKEVTVYIPERLPLSKVEALLKEMKDLKLDVDEMTFSEVMSITLPVAKKVIQPEAGEEPIDWDNVNPSKTLSDIFAEDIMPLVLFLK